MVPTNELESLISCLPCKCSTYWAKRAYLLKLQRKGLTADITFLGNSTTFLEFWDAHIFFVQCLVNRPCCKGLLRHVANRYNFKRWRHNPPSRDFSGVSQLLLVQPLNHVCALWFSIGWWGRRKTRDSNPKYIAVQRFSRPPDYQLSQSSIWQG